jgi:5-methylcytosine-specific restriction protein A
MKRPCVEPGCPELVEDGNRCPKHKASRREYRRRRGDRLGSTYRWRKIRRRALERDGWRCVKCDAPYPLEVDHINGDREDNRLENLQSLCVPCHHAKHR